MVAIHVLTAALLSAAVLKAHAEPTSFYDEYVVAAWHDSTTLNLPSLFARTNEIAIRELVEDLVLREFGPDYADLADREPFLKALTSAVKTGVNVAGKYAGKAANYLGKAGSAAQ